MHLSVHPNLWHFQLLNNYSKIKKQSKLMSLIVLQWSINGNFEGAIMFYNILEQGKRNSSCISVIFLHFFFYYLQPYIINLEMENFLSCKLPLCYWQLACGNCCIASWYPRTAGIVWRIFEPLLTFRIAVTFRMSDRSMATARNYAAAVMWAVP